MSKKSYIKTFWNDKYFEMPDGFFKRKFNAIKFQFIKNKINLVQPFMFICNKTCIADKSLISNSFNGHFVFLKDSVIQQIYERTLSDEDRNELIENFKVLKDAYISVVVFPEKNITVFGRPSNLPEEITNFLVDSTYNFKFISLVGTYFAQPIWAEKFRPCDTRFHQQFSLNQYEIEGLSKYDINAVFNNYMPSSATTYSQRYDPFIRSNKKAENLETVIYCCPNCKKLFTVYSEFNQLKCSDCGTAVEFSSNGNIMLSSNVTDLDSFADLQYDVLKKQFFNDKKPMLKHSAVKIMKQFGSNVSFAGIASVDIYCNKIKINFPSYTEDIKLKTVKFVEFKPNNIVVLTTNNGDKIMLSGSHKQNFYIIHDLLKFMNEIKN